MIGGMTHYVEHLHRTVIDPSVRYIEAVCGTSIRGTQDITSDEVDCPKCLEVKTVWLQYVIEPYTHPDAAEKAAKKLRQLDRKRERMLTAYDHLLLDPFEEDAPVVPLLREPRPKPPVVIRENVGQKPNHRAPVVRRHSYEDQRDAWLRKVTKR